MKQLSFELLPEIEDDRTVDLYAQMSRMVDKVEKFGELSTKDVESLSFVCEVWLMEKSCE